MDWKFTKSIYIMVFLLLNISLGYLLYENYVENADVLQSTRSTLEEANIEIEEIIVPDENIIPAVTANIYNFTAEDTITVTDFDISDEGRRLLYDVTGIDVPMDLEILTNYKNENIFNGSRYVHSDVVSDMQHQVFIQHHNNLPIFDVVYARITLVGENRLLEYYEQSLLHEFEEIEMLIHDTVVAPESIIESMHSRGFIEENSTVESIQIGYDSVFIEEERVLLRPAYEVVVMDESQRQRQFIVDALSLTGAVRERE